MKNSKYTGSGNVKVTSGVIRAFIPPPMPQKNATSKNILFLVRRNIPIKKPDKLHMCMGINLIQG